MATQAQIEANRRNALKSTGPRTDAGKAPVRGNAIRHGFCARWALMSEEIQKNADEILEQLREENQPVGVNEEILVYKMGVALWNFGAALFIAEAMENAVYDETSTPSFALALRYKTTADRQFNQNLRELRKLQKERRLEEIGFVSQEPEPASVEEAQKPETPPAAPPQPQPAAAKPLAPFPDPPAITVIVPESFEIEVLKAPDKAA